MTIPSPAPPPPFRPTWDQYFLRLCESVATRATCDRKHVGCIITKDRRILATGYNGSAVGQPHCDDIGHLMKNGHCVRTVHAEANAIAQCAHHGVTVAGGTVYVTAFPCFYCTKLLVNCGIVRVVYAEDYRVDEDALYAFTLAGVELVKA